MKTKENGGAQPAGAGLPRVSASQLSLLIEIAAIAIQDFKAQTAVAEAHGIYIDAINRAEGKFGALEGRLDPRDPDHAHIIKATKGEFESRQRAKKTAYNVRRRLQTACRKAVRVNATGRGEIIQ